MAHSIFDRWTNSELMSYPPCIFLDAQSFSLQVNFIRPQDTQLYYYYYVYTITILLANQQLGQLI